MNLNRKVGGVLAAIGLATFALAGTASADTNTGNDTTLVAVGSDTTQDVVEGLSGVVLNGTAPVISNYKAIPTGTTVTTRSAAFRNPTCTFSRPANSGQGRDALSAAMRGVAGTGQAAGQTMTDCVDFARSSSPGNPTTSPGVGTMTYVPFATDSVTFATLTASSIPHTLNLTDLKAFYTQNGTPGTATCGSRRPLIPTAGSGTRAFFATLLGITDATIGTAGSWGTCVADVKGGVAIQEHDGRVLTQGTEIIPVSTAQYISQTAGVIGDIRGRASLGSIDFDGAGGANAVSPLLLQTTFGTATRPVFNVVPTQEIDATFTPPAGSSQLPLTLNPTMVSTFVGANSAVCKATLTIQQYGFAPISTCGDITRRNTN